MAIPEIQFAVFGTTNNNTGIIWMRYYSSNSVIQGLELSHKVSRLRAVYPYDIFPHYVQSSEKQNIHCTLIATYNAQLKPQENEIKLEIGTKIKLTLHR